MAMKKIKLTIDDKPIEVNEGSTVLDAAREAGIYIPTLCYNPSLSSDGNCGLCAKNTFCKLQKVVDSLSPREKIFPIANRNISVDTDQHHLQSELKKGKSSCIRYC